MIGKNIRGHRRDETVEAGTLVEFAELLDPIGPIDPIRDRPVPREPDVVVVEELAEPQCIQAPVLIPVPEVVAPPVVTSRFADAGVDDDRLPRHEAKPRRLHR
jgi:hypothetical protein